MTTHETLVAAKSHLLTYGWQKYALGSHRHPCCTGGAIIAVNERYGAEIRVAFDAINAVLDAKWDADFVNFNNADETTFADVIDVFDKAILATAPAPTETKESVYA